MIPPRQCFLRHARMGSTIHIGPFDSPEEALEFAERQQFSRHIVGMIHPEDAVEPDPHDPERTQLKREVWE